MSKAFDKAMLVLYTSEPLISAVLARMRLVPEPGKGYVAKTDGRTIWVGRDGLKLPYRELAFVLAHEVMHALSYHTTLRRPAALKHVHAGMQMDGNTRRLWSLWAIACDVCINTRLEVSQSVKTGRLARPRMDYFNALEIGMKPDWVLNATEEEVFEELLARGFDAGSGLPDLLPAQGAGEGGDGDGDDEGDTNSSAEGASEAGSLPDSPLTPEEVESIVASVAVMRGAGDNDGFIGQEAIAGRYASVLDWRRLLVEALVEPQAGGDVTWSRRSRRSPVEDVIFPASRSHTASLYIIVDMSDSVEIYAERFLSEVRRIMENVDLSFVQVIRHSCSMDVVLETYSKDEALVEMEKLRLRVGGGTWFRPVVEHLVRACRGENPPTAVVWLTDLECSDTTETAQALKKIPSSVPFFWVTPEKVTGPGYFHITRGLVLPLDTARGVKDVATA